MLWIKKFRTRKLQSSLIFLIILMCTLLIAGSGIILTSLNKPYRDLVEETDPVDMKVYPMVNSTISGKDWITELGKLACVNEVTQVNRHYMTEKIMAGENEIEIFITLAVYNEKVHSKVRLLKGSIDDLGENECYISSVIANEEGVAVGDTISFYYGEEHYDYKVKAIFADAYSLSNSFQIETFVKSLPDKLENEPYYAVEYKEGYETEDIIEEYAHRHEGLIDTSFHPVEESIANASITEKILGGILLGMSIIILLVCLFMIRYMIRNSLQKDKKTIAIYKSMGYTDQDIKGIYISFYQIITLAGTIAGVFTTPLITSTFLRAAFENLGVLQKNIGFVQSLVCIGFINLLVYLQLNIELGKIRKIKPVEILTCNDGNLGMKKSKTKPFGRLTFSPFSMALRMLQRDRKNTILIIITCFLSIFIVNVSVICIYNIGNMRASNYYWLGFDKHDVSGAAQGDKETFYRICEELKKNPSVEKLTRRNLDVGYAIPYQQSVAAMVYESYDGLEIPVIEGRNPINNYEIVIGNIYAKELKKEIGDYLEVFLDQDTKVSLLIVGTYQGFYNLGRGIKLNGGLLEEKGIGIEYPECSIILKDGVDRVSFSEELNKTYGDAARFVTRENLYGNIIDMVCSPQKAALGPFAVFTVLIGAFNLIYIIYSKNANNQKVYSIYKSIGYTAGHLIKMNCCYVSILAVISMLIAIPSFILTFPKIMVLSMSAFGFAEYKLVFDPLSMTVANAIVLGVFLISAIVSSRSLKKNDVTLLVNE